MIRTAFGLLLLLLVLGVFALALWRQVTPTWPLVAPLLAVGIIAGFLIVPDGMVALGSWLQQVLPWLRKGNGGTPS